MFSELLWNTLTSVVSLGIRIPDRLLGMAWTVVMAVAPVHTNIAIAVKSLFSWNVIPYRSSKVPVSRWAELLVASHEYQAAVKDKRWEEVQFNFDAIKCSTIKYIKDEAGLISVFPFGCLILKTLKSLFLFIKAQKSFKESLHALQELKEEMQKEDHDRVVEVSR